MPEAVSIENMVIPYSQNSLKIPYAKDEFFIKNLLKGFPDPCSLFLKIFLILWEDF